MLFSRRHTNLRNKWGCERPSEGLAYEPLNQRRLATRSETQMGANDHVCRSRASHPSVEGHEKWRRGCSRQAIAPGLRRTSPLSQVLYATGGAGQHITTD